MEDFKEIGLCCMSGEYMAWLTGVNHIWSIHDPACAPAQETEVVVGDLPLHGPK